MCRPVDCTCGKTTWAGCGEHVDSVRELVPADQWCEGALEHRAEAQWASAATPAPGELRSPGS